MNTTLKEPRSLVRSSWNSITFFGKPKTTFRHGEEDALVRLVGNGSQVAEAAGEMILLDNGFKIRNFQKGEKDMGDDVKQKAGRKPTTERSENPEQEPLFNFKGRKFSASGRLTADGFTVFAGSTVQPVNESFKSDICYYPIRKEMEEDGTIKDGTFTKDTTFRSAQFAGSVVAARAVDARKDWKTADGTTYGEVHPKARKPLSATKAKMEIHNARKASEEPDFDSLPPFEIDEFGIRIERYKTMRDGKVVCIEHRW